MPPLSSLSPLDDCKVVACNWKVNKLLTDRGRTDLSQHVGMLIPSPIVQGTGNDASSPSGDNIEPSNGNGSFFQTPAISPVPFDTRNENKLCEDQQVLKEIITEKIINFSALLNESSAFMSIEGTLSLYLSQEGVFEDIKQYVSNLPTNGEYLENITQGTWWQGNVQIGDLSTLPIYVYNDDIECGNVLGSHAGVNKLNVTYVSVACLPPNKRSRLDHIFPVLITKASNRKFFGNALTFKPVIDELDELLKKGITVKISGNEEKISLRLPLLLGDNLGLNTICGFTENFSTSKHYCRICRASNLQMRKMVVENSFVLRTEENYEADVLKRNMKTTGIKERCAWNKIDGFNIVNNGSIDVTHDLLEQGVVKYVLVFILRVMIYKFHYFTLNNLNSIISSFNFGVDMPNKPPPLGPKHLKENKLRLSASECLCFLKYLGLLVGSYVPRTSKVWKLYFLLRNITDVLLSPVIPKNVPPLLKKLIIQHHTLYQQLSKKNLTAKFHNLIHYPRFIEMFGPPVHYSTIRWESKHRFAKGVANSVATRKNLPITVAKKCQLKVCHDAFANRFAKPVVEWGKLESNWNHSNFVENSACFINSGSLPQNLQDKHTLSTTWAEIDGTKYDIGGTLLFDVDPMDRTPMFGRIEKILVDRVQEVHFLLRNYQTLNFNRHYYAFETQILDTFSIRKSSALADYHPHTLVILPSGSFVSLSHFHTRFDPNFFKD
nr:PREDICTED: uncharacterized protein LOC109038217 [Bemisia tabaci]